VWGTKDPYSCSMGATTVWKSWTFTALPVVSDRPDCVALFADTGAAFVGRCSAGHFCGVCCRAGVGIIAALLIAWVVVELLSLIGPLCRAWDWFVTKETRIRGRQIYLHELVFLGLVAIGQAFLGVRALEGRAWAEDMFLTCLAFEGVILFFGGFFSLMSWLFRKEEEEQLVSLTIEKWALKAEAIADSRAMQVTLNTWQTLVVLTKDFKDKVCHPVQWVP